MYIYICIYTCRERERKRKIYICTFVHISFSWLYAGVYIGVHVYRDIITHTLTHSCILFYIFCIRFYYVMLYCVVIYKNIIF